MPSPAEPHSVKNKQKKTQPPDKIPHVKYFSCLFLFYIKSWPHKVKPHINSDWFLNLWFFNIWNISILISEMGWTEIELCCRRHQMTSRLWWCDKMQKRGRPFILGKNNKKSEHVPECIRGIWTLHIKYLYSTQGLLTLYKSSKCPSQFPKRKIHFKESCSPSVTPAPTAKKGSGFHVTSASGAHCSYAVWQRAIQILKNSHKTHKGI